MRTHSKIAEKIVNDFVKCQNICMDSKEKGDSYNAREKSFVVRFAEIQSSDPAVKYAILSL
jgi:hypothetical protein